MAIQTASFYMSLFTSYMYEFAQLMKRVQEVDCKIGNAIQDDDDLELEPFGILGIEFNLGANAECYNDDNIQANLLSLENDLNTAYDESNSNLNNIVPANYFITAADTATNSTINEITKNQINFYQASDYFHFCIQSDGTCESGFPDPNSVNSWSNETDTLSFANRTQAVTKFNNLISKSMKTSDDIQSVLDEMGSESEPDTILYLIKELKDKKVELDRQYVEGKKWFDDRDYKPCNATSCEGAVEKNYGGMVLINDFLNKVQIDGITYKISDTISSFSGNYQTTYKDKLIGVKEALENNVYWTKTVTEHSEQEYNEDTYKSLIFNIVSDQINLKCNPFQFAKDDSGCQSTVLYNKNKKSNLQFIKFKPNNDTINRFNSNSAYAVNNFSGFDGTNTTNIPMSQLVTDITDTHLFFLDFILNKGVLHLLKNVGSSLLSLVDITKILPSDTIATVNNVAAYGFALQMLASLGSPLGVDTDNKPHYLSEGGRAEEMKLLDPKHEIVLPSQLSTSEDQEPTIPGADAFDGGVTMDMLATVMGIGSFIADLFGGEFFAEKNLNNLLITAYISANFADQSYNMDANNPSHHVKLNQGGGIAIGSGLIPAMNMTCLNLTSYSNKSCSTDQEYIIYGTEGNYSPSTAFLILFLMRFALNFGSSFTNAAINAACAPFDAIPVVGWFISILARAFFVLAESSADMSTLIQDGKPVALYKSSTLTDWTALGGNTTYLVKGMECSSICLTYQNYLQLFTLLKLSNSGKNKSNMLKRIADVVQANSYYAKLGDKTVVNRWWAEKYRILNADTDIQIRGKYAIKPLFMSYGFLGTLSGNPNRKSLMSFKVSNVAGY
ncbi:MAG: DUF5702 domain-containing protein [Bifidobacteriaceae bacterium]|nr:DUF5702 domain-containing protein [Bifidobacteriaceae bacterium]